MCIKICRSLVLFIGSALASHAQATSPTPPLVPTAPIVSALDSSLFYQLMLGEISTSQGASDAGFALLLDAARKTNEPKLFRRAVQIALQGQAGDAALTAAKAWQLAQPKSLEANRYVLQVLIGLNRITETAEPLRHELALQDAVARADAIWSIPALFQRHGDPVQAYGVVKKVLGPYFSDAKLSPTAWATLGRMAIAAGDKAGALTAASTGVNANVRAEHPALLALALLDANVPTAELLLQQHLPHARPEFRMAYVRTLLAASRVNDATAQLNHLQRENPLYPDAWLVQGALTLQANRYEDANRMLQKYLDLTATEPDSNKLTEYRRGRSQAFFYLAQIAEQSNDFTTADGFLAKVDEPREILRAQIRRAVLLSRQGQLDAALELIKAQPDRHEGDSQQKRAAMVQLLKKHKQLDRARVLLQTILTDQPGDTDVMYELAMLHESMGALEDMERLLRQLMTDSPSDPQAFNALGYALADRNLRLPEARELIMTASRLAPQDAYIRDSLGWVEFRLGNLQTALSLLESAYKERPDVEIAAHLGEVLWNLQRTEQAKSIWREGRALSPDNESLNSTLKRLQVLL